MFARSLHRTSILLTLLAILALTASGAISAQSAPNVAHPVSTTEVNDSDFRSSPVMFIENAGQWPEAACFQVWGGTSGTMWLTEDAIWLTVVERSPSQVAGSQVDRLRRFSPEPADLEPETFQPKAVNIKLSFLDANPHPRVEPFDRLDTKVSYFIGNDPDQWRPDVPVWGGVRYVDLYPGVDLEITSDGGRMVQRLAARPGADLSAVRLRVEGADAVTVEGDMLHLSTAAGDAVWPLLRADRMGIVAAQAQPLGAQAFDVATPFALMSVNLQSTIRSPQSVADNPADLLYSTFLGGSNNEGNFNIAVDGGGAAYVAGWTNSADFPTTPGVFDRSYNGGEDTFVVKVSPSGTALAYATFLGGSASDGGAFIAVDGSEAAYVAGYTASADFPTTPGVFDRSYNGGEDTFVVKVSPSGTALAYATFLGGSASDGGSAIAVDGSEAAYVTGYTASADFPTTPGVFDRSYGGGDDAFVVKVNPSGSALVYGSFLSGGSLDNGDFITVDGSGAAYVTGWTKSADFPTTPGSFDRSYGGGYDAFVVKVNPSGSALVYATFLGGSSGDSGMGITVDESGAAYVAGRTKSADFPTTPDSFDRSYNGGDGDAFVIKMNSTGSALVYATFLGGSSHDLGHGISTDGDRAAYITGYTASADFPTTPDSFDRSYGGGYDAFVVKVNPSGSALVYATFLGGSNSDMGYGIAVDGSETAYVTGYTASIDFPTAPGSFDGSHNGGDYDAFVARLAMGLEPTYTIPGRVTDTSARGIPGVTVWAGSSSSTTTDANGNYTFTGLPAGTYSLVAEKAGYAICPHSRQVTVPPDALTQSFTGIPTVANLGFCPSEDGYRFSNGDPGWGNYPSSPASGDFTMEDMRRMFGDQAVCITPAVPGLPCAYKLSAWAWNGIVNLSMNKGHCAGMAATSLRFFKDVDQPADFQTGVTSTFGLDLLGNTRRNIAYYHVEQSALPILSYKLSQQLTSTPATTLDALRAAISGGASDPVVLVLKSGQNQHAVTPIALEDRGNGIWAVWVYDNELPGTISAVLINTPSNTWSRGAWSGDAASHSLYVIPVSLFNGPQICPFCISPVGAATAFSQPATGQIWLTENANLLITDSAGRRLGYVGDQLVSEIPGAGRVDFIGGTSHPAIPVYSIPLTETYTMLLDGQPLTRTQTLGLAQFGPGYAASIENLAVSPTTRDELSIVSDGSKLLYRANADKEATLTLVQDAANQSNQFSLRGVELAASQSITLTNDVNTGRLAFANSQGASNSYDLAITRATGAAGVTRFYHADLTAVPGDVQSFNYRAWDGVGSLVMQIDHDGNGTIDETRILENQIKKVYLPVTSRK